MSSSLSIYRSIYLSTYLSFYLSIYLYVYLSVYLSTYQKRSKSARLPYFFKLATSKTQQLCEASSSFELDNVKNAAIHRDFLNFCASQRQKRRNSARRPHFSKVTTSKTKQFCSCRCALRFFIPSVCDFSFHLCRCVCAPATKVRPGHMKCPTRHAKSS